MASIIDVLPYEIISTIIDNLVRTVVLGDEDYADDNDALQDIKACSLTCHALLPLCRRHIFKSISLQSHDPLLIYNPNGTTTSTTTLFARLLAHSPTLAEYVQKLQFQFQFQSHDFDFDYESSPLPRALRPLTNLQAIDFLDFGSAGILDWQHIPPLLRADLVCLMHLPTIVSIRVAFMKNFSLIDLVPCEGLKSLYFTQVGLLENDDHAPSTWPVKPIKLDQVGFSYCDGALQHRLGTQLRADGGLMFDLEVLKSFEVEMMDLDDLLTATEFLHRTSRLETIKSNVSDNVDGGVFISMLSTASLNTLNTLKVFELELDFDETLPDPLSGICTPLQNIASKNCIESLGLSVSFDIDQTCSRIDTWGALEKALLAPGWPSLREVNLRITLYIDGGYWEEGYPRQEVSAVANPLGEALRELPEKQLKRLSSTKSFVFKFAVTEVIQ